MREKDLEEYLNSVGLSLYTDKKDFEYLCDFCDALDVECQREFLDDKLYFVPKRNISTECISKIKEMAINCGFGTFEMVFER